MKGAFHTCIAVCVLAAMAGCAPQVEQDTAQQKVIGISLLTQTHVFFQDLVKAMGQAAKEHDFILRVQYCEFDGAKQNDQLETYMLQKVDAIVLSPPDSAAVGAVIAEARAKDIPVFTVDIEAQGADVVSHVASDNVKGGRIIAEYLAKLLDGKGKIAIIHQPETSTAQDRVRGFTDVMDKYPAIDIVQILQGHGQRDKALHACQDVLQANPDLNGIFGINDDSALGALAAVESAGRQDQIAIVGFDGTPEARDAILKGTALKADTVQFPDKIGRKTIETVAAYFRGEELPKWVPVEVGIIDQASLKAEEGS